MDTNKKRMMDAGATEYVEFGRNESGLLVYHRPDEKYDVFVKDVSADAAEKILRIAKGSMVNKPKWMPKNPLPFGSVFLMHSPPCDFYWIPTGKALRINETGSGKEQIIWSTGCLVIPCEMLGLPYIGNGMSDGEEYYTDVQLSPNVIFSYFTPGEKVEFPYERSGDNNFILVRRYENGWIMKKVVEPKKIWKFKRGDRVVWLNSDHGTIVACLDEPVMNDGYIDDYKVCWDEDLHVGGAAESNLKLED